jgi:hypothetical protein
LFTPGVCVKRSLLAFRAGVPSYHRCFNTFARFNTSPILASPLTRERNNICANMVFAKEFKRLVNWRIAVMNESVQALLSCRHSSYGVPLSKITNP